MLGVDLGVAERVDGGGVLRPDHEVGRGHPARGHVARPAATVASTWFRVTWRWSSRMSDPSPGTSPWTRRRSPRPRPGRRTAPRWAARRRAPRTRARDRRQRGPRRAGDRAPAGRRVRPGAHHHPGQQRAQQGQEEARPRSRRRRAAPRRTGCRRWRRPAGPRACRRTARTCGPPRRPPRPRRPTAATAAPHQHDDHRAQHGEERRLQRPTARSRRRCPPPASRTCRTN